MKRGWIASLCLTAGMAAHAQSPAQPPAQAQSSVQISGIAEAYVGTATTDRGGRVVRMHDTASRLTFSGVEDLGGGLKATFRLDSGIAIDTGAGTLPGPGFGFTREARVGLQGPWGGVEAGRMYPPSFFPIVKWSPYILSTAWSPAVPLLPTTGGQTGLVGYPFRLDNSVRYRTPVWGGVQGDVFYTMGEAGNGSSSGKGLAGALAYDQRGYHLSYSFQRINSGTAAAPVASPTTSTHHVVVAMADFGFIKPGLLWVTNRTDAPNVRSGRLFGISAVMPVGAGVVLDMEAVQRKVSGTPIEQTGATFGANYLFSKRTSVYLRLQQLTNEGNAALTVASIPVAGGDKIRQVGLGLRHLF